MTTPSPSRATAWAGTVVSAVRQRYPWAAQHTVTGPGDVVLAMVAGGQQVALDTLEAFERMAAALRPAQQVTLLIRRGDTTSYVSLRASR